MPVNVLSGTQPILVELVSYLPYSIDVVTQVQFLRWVKFSHEGWYPFLVADSIGRSSIPLVLSQPKRRPQSVAN
jgi:hypothetical protein